MGQHKPNVWFTRFKQFMTPDTINAIGRRVGLCQRQREVTPWRLGLSLLTGFATQELDSLADVQRLYNALFGTTLMYKPFHKQLAKASFADFMRVVAGQLLAELRVQILRAHPGDVFDGFERVLIQDGSSFALKEDLAGVYPGRFNKQKPAAVELHTTLALFDGAPSRIQLTPDTAPERDYLPDAGALAGSLLFADRGYFKRTYLAALDDAGACFIVRASTSINPQVIRAFNGQGKRRPQCDNQTFNAVYRGPHHVLDLDVRWAQDGWSTRLIVSRHPDKKQHLIIATNLSRSRYSAAQIQQMYRIRWQIELLFKEYKSFAQLHAFRTANPAIAEGLIWAAVAAATLQRFIAHTAQRVHAVEISTQKVAKNANAALLDLFKALAANRTRCLRKVFEAVLAYLAVNAQRAHPKRDRCTGRLQLGLETVGVA